MIDAPHTERKPNAPPAGVILANGRGMDFSQAPRQRDLSGVDFKTIDAAALPVLLSLLRRWAPDEGRIDGCEYTALNPRREEDTNAGSFKVNLLTGRWSEFAGTDAGTSVLTLAGYIADEDDLAKVAGWLTDMLAGRANPEAPVMFAPLTAEETESAEKDSPRAGAKSEFTPVIPVPATAPPTADYSNRELGNPVALWPYHDAAGRLVGYVARFESIGADGAVRKEIRPLTYCETKDGGRAWRLNGIPEPRPLYRLPEILARPEAPILVCEGEKTADAARVLFPECVTTTAMHGAKSPGKTDWSPVKGREVIIAPDADAAGQKYRDSVARLCQQAGATVGELCISKHLTVRDGALVPSDEPTPQGWDLADALAEGWTHKMATAAIVGGLIQARTLPAPAGAVSAPYVTAPVPEIEWPEPADLLNESLEAPPAFPVDFLPDMLGRFTKDVADRMQCPTDYVAVPLLIEAAALIGKDFRFAPKAHDPWAERPCLWGGLIGEPGTLKSPALTEALRPIRSIETELAAEYKESLAAYEASTDTSEAALKRWKAECKSAEHSGLELPLRPPEAAKPEEPIMRRVLTGDATQEALVDLMAKNPRGMMLYRDELSGWYKGLNQYRQGGDRQFFLECHAGGGSTKDRKLAGSTFISDLFLCIVGGLQPAIVADVLRDGDADGFSARFSLLVWPDPIRNPLYIDRQADAEAASGVNKIMRELFTLEPSRIFGEMDFAPNPVIRFDQQGQAVFVDWYKKHMARLNSEELTGPIKNHLSKYAGLFARLALVHHLIRVVEGTAAETDRADAKTAAAVAALLGGYLEPHARRVYEHLAQNTARQGARKIAHWIASAPDLTAFSARQVRRHGWTGLTDQDGVNAALDYLENVCDWVRCKTESPGPRGGRPRTTYEINPKVRG